MKSSINTRLYGFVITLLLFAFIACSKKSDDTNPTPISPTTPTAPVLTTTSASAITQTTATSGGNISSDGGKPVTARGICWSTTHNPTIAGSKTSDGTGAGSFNSSITGLITNTTYYVRAYATNSVGTSYGSEVSFSTLTPTIWTYTKSYAYASSYSLFTNKVTFRAEPGKEGTILPTGNYSLVYILPSGSATVTSSISSAAQITLSQLAPLGSTSFDSTKNPKIRIIDSANHLIKDYYFEKPTISAGTDGTLNLSGNLSGMTDSDIIGKFTTQRNNLQALDLY